MNGPSHASIVNPQRDLFSNAEQTELSDLLCDWLEDATKQRGKSPLAALYFLVSFTWGWARRCAWSTETLTNYAGTAWQTNKRVANERPRKRVGDGWIPELPDTRKG